jgi:hypothetical protein
MGKESFFATRYPLALRRFDQFHLAVAFTV